MTDEPEALRGKLAIAYEYEHARGHICGDKPHITGTRKGDRALQNITSMSLLTCCFD